MDTISCIQRAIDFIEDNIFDDLRFEVIASQAYMSNFQFQRTFSIICNISLGEYIRNRKLALAGIEISKSKDKIIDIAFKYGYESPESFSRAFTRFHGINPLFARNNIDKIISFPKIYIKSILGGKLDMQSLKQRGYTVKENGPVYYTNDMDRTAKWFENVLGWYVSIDARNNLGSGIYGCALPLPEELLSMKITTFNGIHIFKGEPSKEVIAFMRVEGLEKLYSFVKENGWTQITEIKNQNWGGKECYITTIDGSLMRFFEL